MTQEEAQENKKRIDLFTAAALQGLCSNDLVLKTLDYPEMGARAGEIAIHASNYLNKSEE